MERPEQPGKSIRYQIHIYGKLDPKWSQWFADFSVTHTNGVTVLEGAIADQSALYGILIKIHDLGLTLLRVQRISNEMEREMLINTSRL